MNSITMLVLFAAFGGVCGFYLSVVGFAITSAAICLLVGLASAVLGGPFAPLLLLGAFFAQQVGFFVAVIARAVVLHVLRLRARPQAGAAESEFRTGGDRPR